MNMLTVTPTRSLSVKSFKATSHEASLVELAINSYGHLLTSQPPETYTFAAFADIIAKHYDVENNLQNRSVVNALKTVHTKALKALH